jgi:PAS domain S-box-containing protein
MAVRSGKFMSLLGGSGINSERERITDLTRAFNLFRKEMGRLGGSYQALKQQFLEVNLQLEQKVAELDDATTYLQGILDYMAQGILFIDEEGIITTCNPAAERILGRPAEQLLQTSYLDHYDESQFGLSVRAAMAGEEVDAAAVALTRPDGSLRHLDVLSTRAQKGLILLLRDKTEVRQLQLQAERNDRLKELGEMAAAVAHEIRNPLGGIKGFASLLQRDLATQPHLAQMALSIVEGTTTLDRLVSNVLAYARPLDIQLAEVDVRQIAEEVHQLVVADAQLTHGISIELRVPETAVLLRVDRERIKSALLNLVVNGCQAMAQGGSLKIELERAGRFTVSDTGAGISSEDLKKLFSPFFTTKERGNGLGLAEVYKVVAAHGGTVGVESQLGLGSTFWIQLGR